MTRKTDYLANGFIFGIERKHSLSAVFLSSAFALLVMSGMAVNAEPVRILPVGDSNTMGCCDYAMGGYRSRLKELLLAAGIETDYLGSQTGGSTAMSDPEHEGRQAWGVQEIQGLVDAGMIESYPADYCLLEIGANNMWDNLVNRGPADDGKATMFVGLLGNLIDDIMGRRPQMHLIVAKPTTPGNAQQPLAIYRAGIDALVAERAAEGKLISSIDLVGCENDGTHFTTAGHYCCAQRWYDGFMLIYNSGSVAVIQPNKLSPIVSKSSTVFSFNATRIAIAASGKHNVTIHDLKGASISNLSGTGSCTYNLKSLSIPTGAYMVSVDIAGHATQSAVARIDR
jgi:hypothetical protein